MSGYDCSAACATAQHIPGWLAPPEAAYLYEIGFRSEGDILELGTYFGKSTYLMARGIRDAGKPYRVLTIDIHSRGIDPETQKLQILAEDSLIAVCRALKIHGLADVVIQMIGWTHQCVPLLNFDTIRTIFIDAGHDYESCSQDFLCIRKQAPRNQKLQLLMHDYSSSFPGVQRTIDKLVRPDPRTRHVTTIHSLFHCELIPEGEQSSPARRLLHQLSESWPLSVFHPSRRRFVTRRR